MNFAQNLSALSAGLRTAGAVSATAEYAGYGDSGDHFSIEIQWPDAPAPSPETGGASIRPAIALDLSREFADLLESPPADFDSAFENLVQDAVSFTGHDGWENNEGGGGTFTLRADGTARLEHYDNIENFETSEHDFTTDSELGTRLAILCQALASAGAQSATVEYAGYGDSGSIENVEVQWPATPSVPPRTVQYPTASSVWNEQDKKYGTVYTDSDRDFNTAIEDLLEQAIALSGHAGWENNDGGSGTLTLFADGTAHLVHRDHFIEQVTDSHEFDAPGNSHPVESDT